MHLLRPWVLALSWVPAIGDRYLATLLLRILLCLVAIARLLVLKRRAYRAAELMDLIQNHGAHVVDFLDDLEAEVEFGGTVWLVAGVVPDC